MAKKKELSVLDKLNADLKTKFGSEVVVDFNDSTAMTVERLPTSSPRINKILGGGVPRGRILEIYGPESSGKTTFASYLAGQFQANNEIVAFVDAEHALDPEYAKTIGYDTSKGIFSQPDSGEEALNVVLSLAESGEVGFIVVDSVAALTPQKELDGEIGDATIGLQARMMSQAMRKLRGACKKTNTTLLFINQVRMRIGVMFGNPECITPGSRVFQRYTDEYGNDNNLDTFPIKDIFLQAGVDFTSMEENTSIDVQDKNVKVIGYQDNGEYKACRILKVVRKEDSKVVKIRRDGKLLFKCSYGHKIWMEHMEDYVSIEDLLATGEKEFNTWTALPSWPKPRHQDFKHYGYFTFTIEETKVISPILDFEVEGTHNYFANGVLSHNTTSGGNALKFYASIRMEVRQKEKLFHKGKGVTEEEETAIGQISRIKTIKNKTAPPFKKALMKVIYGKGVQVEEEWIEAAVQEGFIIKGGAGWVTLPNGTKLQGMDNTIAYYKDNPKEKDSLIKKVQDHLDKVQSNFIEQDEEIPSDDEIVSNMLTDKDLES